MIGQDDVPHLSPPHISAEDLKELEDSIQPHQRKARTKGIPSLGSGAIYPVDEDAIFVEPFPIPEHWERAYAMDVGWNKTAALFGARDPDTSITYLTAEYYHGEQLPAVHAHAIRSMMLWEYTGAMDPAARGRSQRDGRRLMQEYQDLALNLVAANNAVSAGIHRCLMLMQGGLLKAFSTLTNFKTELRLYRRDENGKIVKERDHLMDDMRYLMNTDGVFRTEPQNRALSARQGEW